MHDGGRKCMMVVENVWRLAEAGGGGPKMRGGSQKHVVMG